MEHPRALAEGSALIDLKKAEALFEAELVMLDAAKVVDLWNTGLFPMVELLATPPRAAARSFWATVPVGGLETGRQMVIPGREQ